MSSSVKALFRMMREKQDAEFAYKWERESIELMYLFISYLKKQEHQEEIISFLNHSKFKSYKNIDYDFQEALDFYNREINDFDNETEELLRMKYKSKPAETLFHIKQDQLEYCFKKYSFHSKTMFDQFMFWYYIISTITGFPSAFSSLKTSEDLKKLHSGTFFDTFETAKENISLSYIWYFYNRECNYN